MQNFWGKVSVLEIEKTKVTATKLKVPQSHVIRLKIMYVACSVT